MIIIENESYINFINHKNNHNKNQKKMDQQLRQTLIKGLSLYYRILKLHQKALPGKLRKLGDLYVKQEFRYHHTNPNLNYYKQFYDKWLAYQKELSTKGLHDASKPLSPQQTKLLNKDQQQALNNLKQQIEKKNIIK